MADADDASGADGDAVDGPSVNLKPGGHERRRSSLVDISTSQIIQRRSQHLSQDMTQALAQMSASNLASIAGQADVVVDPYIEANTEVQELSADKTKIEEAFQKIDIEHNEDIEIDEFVVGLKDVLKVDLNELEIRELFGFMDNDESNFISSTEWTMFLTQRYESKLLEQYKDAILSKILSNPHKRKHSNLVQNAEDWDEYEMTKEQREMKAAMGAMLDPLVQELKVEDTLLTDLRKHEQEDEDFGNPDRVAEWTKWEVASWLTDLKFENYELNFLKNEIDGANLLFDMSHGLMTHVGVLRAHQGKLERAINDLKKHRSDLFGLEECLQENSAVSFEWNPYQLGPKPQDRVKQLEQELEQARERYRTLQDQFMDIKTKLDIAQEQGFGLSDEDAGSDVSEDLIRRDSISADGNDSPVPPLEPADPMDRQASSGSAEQPAHGRSETTMTFDDDAAADAAVAAVFDDEDATGRLNRASTVIENDVDPMGSGADLQLASPASAASGGSRKLPSVMESGSPKKPRHRKKKSSFSGKKKPPPGTPAFWVWLETEQGMQPNFANPKRVLKWTAYEVAWWMFLQNYKNYAINFLNEKVTGEMLVRDLSTVVMKEELGVKMLHCGNILRRIKELRDEAGVENGEQGSKPKKGKRGGGGSGYLAQLDTEERETVAMAPTVEYLDILSKLVEFDELKQSRNQFENELLEKQEQIEELERDIENLTKQISELKSNQEEMEKERVEILSKQEEEDRNKEKERAEHEMYDPDFKSIPKEVRSIMTQIKNEAESNSTFCDQQNANNWSAKEVAYWLELINFSDYIPGFLKQRIDGEILLSDMDKQILTTELGVLSSHAAKILRQRDRLKSSVPETYSISVIDGPEMKPDKNLSAEVQELEKQLKEAQDELEELRSKPQVPEDHMIIKNDEYNLLQSTIEDKKKEIESLQQAIEAAQAEAETERVKLKANIENLESKLHDIEEAAIPEQEKQEKMEKEQEYLSELSARAESDETFGSLMRIKEWTIDEVCWWLHGFGMEQYFQKFKDQNITGSILVNDIGVNELESYFNIKTMHRSQVMRELDELKIKAFGRLDIELDIAGFTHEPEHRGYQLLATIAELEDKIKQLNENYENSQQDAGAKAGNITELTDQISELKAQIEKLEFEMSQEEWINRKKQLEEDVAKISEELEVKQEVKDLKDDLAQRARDNPTFANPKLAFDWSVDEVLHWIYTLEIGNDYIQTFRKAAISGSALLSDCNPDVLQKDLGVAAYHVGKMMRDIERLRKLGNKPLNFVTSVTDVLFIDEFLASHKIEDLEGMAQDEKNMREALALEADKLRNDIVRLQEEISGLEEAAQMMSEQLENQTKGGPNDTGNAGNAGNAGAPVSQNLSDFPPNMAAPQQGHQDDQKASAAEMKANSEEIKKLEREIVRMTEEKIALVKATAEEMDSLRKIVLVLSREYEAISGTPLGRVAPYATVDGFLGALGLERSKR